MVVYSELHWCWSVVFTCSGLGQCLKLNLLLLLLYTHNIQAILSQQGWTVLEQNLTHFHLIQDRSTAFGNTLTKCDMYIYIYPL